MDVEDTKQRYYLKKDGWGLVEITWGTLDNYPERISRVEHWVLLNEDEVEDYVEDKSVEDNEY